MFGVCFGEPSLVVQERKERKSKRGDDRLDDAGQKIKTYQVKGFGTPEFWIESP